MAKDPHSYRPKGQITDRLLKLFGKDSPGWNPPREGGTKKPKTSKTAGGWSLGDALRGKEHGRGAKKNKGK